MLNVDNLDKLVYSILIKREGGGSISVHAWRPELEIKNCNPTPTKAQVAVPIHRSPLNAEVSLGKFIIPQAGTSYKRKVAKNGK